MNGYWYGTYSGSNSGQIVVELDDVGTHFEGCAYLYEAKAGAPSTFAIIKTANKATKSRVKAQLLPLNPETFEPTEWHRLASQFPGTNFPVEADVDYEWSATDLRVSWITNIQTYGGAHIPKSAVSRPSACKLLQVANWAVISPR
jgi:hypothetical protein